MNTQLFSALIFLLKIPVMKSHLFVRQFLNSRLIDHPSEFSWTFLIWPSLPLTLNHSEVIFLLHGKPAAKLCLIWLFNICYMLVWCGGWGVGSTKKNLTDAMAYTISYIYCNVEFWIVTIHNMIILSKVLYCFHISHCYNAFVCYVFSLGVMFKWFVLVYLKSCW